MNLSLFKSWYSVLALLGIAAAIACSLVAGDIADVRWLRLATGWLAGSSMALASSAAAHWARDQGRHTRVRSSV